jgi:hypothetical protein
VIVSVQVRQGVVQARQIVPDLIVFDGQDSQMSGAPTHVRQVAAHGLHVVPSNQSPG